MEFSCYKKHWVAHGNLNRQSEWLVGWLDVWLVGQRMTFYLLFRDDSVFFFGFNLFSGEDYFFYSSRSRPSSFSLSVYGISEYGKQQPYREKKNIARNGTTTPLMALIYDIVIKESLNWKEGGWDREKIKEFIR